MTWQRRLALKLLKHFDRDRLVRLLAAEHRPFSWSWWQMRGLKGLMQSLSAADIFSLIYAKNIWGSAESHSGGGSTLQETAKLREALPALLRQLQIDSLLDIPCGDYHWMSDVDLEGIRYIGADIVPDLIEKTAQRYAGQQRRFVCLDLIADPLPKVDAIFCRDCLVHLPNREIGKALNNIRASGATYLLTTTFPQRQTNEDIALGYWRPINLQCPPFNFPPPLVVLHEGNPEPAFADKSLAVWRIADLPEA